MRTEITGIGACVADTVYTVPYYPSEDKKLKANECRTLGGGPVSTALVAASKLGAKVSYIGNLSDDSSGVFLKNDFIRYGVSTENVNVISGYSSFSSVLILSEESKSRTCIYDRGNLPGLSLSAENIKAIKESDVLMLDGNETKAAVSGARIANESGTRVLYDCDGRYPEYEKLLPLTDIMIPSEDFALAVTGLPSAEDAAVKLFSLYDPEVVVVTQGKNGGIMYDGKDLLHYPVFPADVVDTNGAGDVFHGAFAVGLLKKYDFYKCCLFASAVSALKCRGIGARENAPVFETVKEYMKENGYEL